MCHMENWLITVDLTWKTSYFLGVIWVYFSSIRKECSLVSNPVRVAIPETSRFAISRLQLWFWALSCPFCSSCKKPINNLVKNPSEMLLSFKMIVCGQTSCQSKLNQRTVRLFCALKWTSQFPNLCNGNCKCSLQNYCWEQVKKLMVVVLWELQSSMQCEAVFVLSLLIEARFQKINFLFINHIGS